MISFSRKIICLTSHTFFLLCVRIIHMYFKQRYSPASAVDSRGHGGCPTDCAIYFSRSCFEDYLHKDPSDRLVLQCVCVCVCLCLQPTLFRVLVKMHNVFSTLPLPETQPKHKFYRRKRDEKDEMHCNVRTYVYIYFF